MHLHGDGKVVLASTMPAHERRVTPCRSLARLSRLPASTMPAHERRVTHAWRALKSSSPRLQRCPPTKGG